MKWFTFMYQHLIFCLFKDSFFLLLQISVVLLLIPDLCDLSLFALVINEWFEPCLPVGHWVLRILIELFDDILIELKLLYFKSHCKLQLINNGLQKNLPQTTEMALHQINRQKILSPYHRTVIKEKKCYNISLVKKDGTK